MEYIIIATTLLAVAAIGYVYYSGYRAGVRRGQRQGRDAAIKELLLMKDPDAWNMARVLEIDKPA